MYYYILKISNILLNLSLNNRTFTKCFKINKFLIIIY